jgi:hypothetical protein
MVLPSGKKTTFRSTGHHHPWSGPLHAYALFPVLLPFFLMDPGSHVLWGYSAPLAILPQMPQLCQNGFIFNRGNRENLQGAKSGDWGGWRMTVVLFLVKNSLVKNEVWDSVLSQCNSQFFVTKVCGKIFSYFHTVTIKVTVTEVCRIAIPLM